MPEQNIKVCVDKVLPNKSPYDRNVFYTRDLDPIEILRLKKWDKKILRIQFLEGDPKVQSKVASYAKEVEKFANIRFEFVREGPADIRISFQRDGSWSYIGNDALDIPPNEPTMNFGWLTPNSLETEYSSIVLHLFGHVLGFIHEYQAPQSGIPWDKEAVYHYFGKPPYNWTKEEVDRNIFERYSRHITNDVVFDSHSVMIFAIPAEFTANRNAIGSYNPKLSDADKRRINALY